MNNMRFKSILIAFAIALPVVLAAVVAIIAIQAIIMKKPKSLKLKADR